MNISRDDNTSRSKPSSSNNHHYRSILERHANDKFQEGWDHLMGDHYRSINRKLGQSLIISAMNDGSLVARGFCEFRGWGGADKNVEKSFRSFCDAESKASSMASLLPRGEQRQEEDESINSFRSNALALKGYFCRNGYGTSRNTEEAIELLSCSVSINPNQGWAMAMLAYWFQEDHADEAGNSYHKHAFKLYKKSAKTGYSKAMYNLAELYLTGNYRGVTEDRRKGMKWLEQAASLGYVEAQERLREENEADNIKNDRGRRRGRSQGALGRFGLGRSKSRVADPARTQSRGVKDGERGRRNLSRVGTSRGASRRGKSRDIVAAKKSYGKIQHKNSAYGSSVGTGEDSY